MKVNPGIRLMAPLMAWLLVAPATALAKEPSGTFAVISDIHFNPFDPPDLAPRLAAAPPGDWAAIFATVEDQKASSYGSDTNYALLKSAVDALTRAAAGVDFVIVPGDFLAHDFERTAARALGVGEDDPAVRNLTAKTTVFVAETLRAALPATPLIPALGNDDAECGDYRIEPDGPFLAATAAALRETLGKDALDPDFEETYLNGGYYAVRHPTVPDAVVIVLNDTLWSAKYDDSCGAGDPDGAADMLVWLEERLARAKGAGDSVWMVRHVPAGIDAYATAHSRAPTCAERITPLLREPYATRLPELMREYAAPVQASLTGHIHHDSYRILTAPDGTILDVDKIVPAISPVFGQNPSFQIFRYEVTTGAPTGFETRYLSDLDAVSLSSPGTWKIEYDFADVYGMPDFSAQSVMAMWRSIAVPGPMRETFARLYNVGHGSISEEDMPSFLCALRHVDVEAFAACYCGG